MARTNILRRLHAVSAQRLSRRRFLQWSAITAGALMLPSRANSLHMRVGIIGGGAAGLAAAYWLKTYGIPFTLLEASSRWGGRVFTVPKWNSEQQFIELGGELLNTIDQETLWLARRLEREQKRALAAGRKFEAQDLRILKFEDGEKDSTLHSSLYLDGDQVYTGRELEAGLSELAPRLAALNKEIFGTFDGDLTYRSIQNLPKAVEWDRAPLARLFEWMSPYADRWCLKVLKSAYEAEYGLPAEQQSSLNLLTMFDTDLSGGFNMFGKSDEALRLGGGNSALIRALLNSLGDYGRRPLEGFLQPNHALTSIHSRGGKFNCGFRGSRAQNFTHLIVAAPLTQLKKIGGWESLKLSAAKAKLIENLGMGQNAKVMSEYRRRFWRDAGSVSTRASQGEVYLSDSSGVVWETSRLQPGTTGILAHYTTGGAPVASQNTAALLTKVFGETALNEATGRVAAFDWPRHGLSEGSFSCLRPGQVTEFWGAGAEPECSGRLVFAGEHTSVKSQGFINGGYESGLRAARAILKINS